MEHSYEAVRDYLNERISEGIKEDEPIFVDDYNNTLKFFKKIGYNRELFYFLFLIILQAINPKIIKIAIKEMNTIDLF